MSNTLKGRAFVYGANVDTDQIYPATLLTITDADKVGKHAMEGADPSFAAECQPGDMIVASTNFGCGSSREHAAVTLKAAGVSAVIAASFGRIFYRNAINLGLLAITCKDLHGHVKKGDLLSLNAETGKIVNETTGETFRADPLSDYVLNIIRHGGIKPMMKETFTKSRISGS